MFAQVTLYTCSPHLCCIFSCPPFSLLPPQVISYHTTHKYHIIQLTQLNSTHATQLTQLNSHNSTHTSELTQLNLHNSTHRTKLKYITITQLTQPNSHYLIYTTQLTQLNSLALRGCAVAPDPFWSLWSLWSLSTMLNVTLYVSSLWHTAWRNYDCDDAVPCGFAWPRWTVHLRVSVPLGER